MNPRSAAAHRPAFRLLALLLALAGLLLALTAPLPARAENGPGHDRGRHGDGAAHGWIASKIMRMTLQEKVGQLFMTYAYGQSATTQEPDAVAANQATYGVDNAAQLIDRYHLGGIIYFTWSGNVENVEQTARLSNGIQQSALDQRLPIPALIATDQEGGIVARVGPPATQFPGNMALGAGRRVDDARTAAAITAEELAAQGIVQNFAPVADVNVNPQNPVIGVRSFGEDPQLVAEMTAAQVEGYQSQGVAAAAKHFPGHGDTDVDSHTGFPVIDHTRAEWERIDKPPFQAAIEQGVDMIMTAHIAVPSLDPSGDPATLSRPILTGILRKQMNFDGVVITDSLGMAAVREKYGDDRVPVLALKAGADMLLMPPKFDVAYNAVLDAVRSGELTERRIDRSVYRILKLKYELGLFDDPYVDVSAVDDNMGTPEHYAAAQAITDRTTTLVKNDGDVLPLDAGSGQDALITGWGVSTTRTVADKMTAHGMPADRYETGASPSQAEIDQAVARAENHDATVVLTYRAWTDGNASQRELVRRLVDTGKPVIAVSVRDPYDIGYFTDVPAFLTTYSWTEVSLESLVRVLVGEQAPQGKLPVTIPVAGDPSTALYPYGHGLTY